MAILDNSPTFSYIRATGIIVHYYDEVYNVAEKYSCMKYIYWNRKNPYELEDSDILFDNSDEKFLVITNTNGMHNIVPQVENSKFSISFDGDSIKSIEKHIYGLYEKDEENDKRFVSIETDITGVKTTIVDLKEEDTKIKENITKLELKSDEIDASVKSVRKDFTDNKEINELRENVNKTIIELNAAIGLYSSKITEYFKDDKITNEEKTEINIQNTIIDDKKKILYIQIEKVILICDKNFDTTGKLNIDNAKNALNEAHENLKTAINSVITDSVATPSDKVLVINTFSKYNIKINELKNVLDNIILLGVGGSISEELANFNMRSNQITMSVQETEKNVKSEIKILSDEIALKVSKGEFSSLIEQKYDSVRIAFNKISSASVTIDYRGLTVLNGSIACDCLTTPRGHDPIIRLFEDSSATICLDAQESNGSVKGSAVRLKYNENYLFINRLGANVFVDGEVRLQVKQDDAFVKCGNARFCFTNDPYSFFPDQGRTDLGQSYNTWRNVYCDTLRCDDVRSTSDSKFKENINYIDSSKKRFFSMNIETPFLEFLKNDLRIATFNYKNFSEEENNQQVGFIANDIKNTKIGKMFIYDYGDEGLKFSVSGYTTVVVAALKEEVLKREELENKIKELEINIQELQSKGE
ncbi:tail fiber domain-containing protein [Clostridioides difficile]|nr:tail fiber domain-containing protein [Clostridioides difficile]MDK3170272.1 tail fiber domain-containing protein [Clostridioides difficile]